MSSLGYGRFVIDKLCKIKLNSLKIPVLFIIGSFARDFTLFLTGTFILNKLIIYFFFGFGLFFFRYGIFADTRKLFINPHYLFIFTSLFILAFSCVISTLTPVFFDFQSYHFYLPEHFLRMKKISAIDYNTHSLFFSYFHSGYLFFAALKNYNAPLVLQVIICCIIAISGAELFNENIFKSLTLLMLTPFFLICIYMGNTDLITALIVVTSFGIILNDKLILQKNFFILSIILLLLCFFVKVLNIFYLIAALFYITIFYRSLMNVKPIICIGAFFLSLYILQNKFYLSNWTGVLSLSDVYLFDGINRMRQFISNSTVTHLLKTLNPFSNITSLFIPLIFFLTIGLFYKKEKKKIGLIILPYLFFAFYINDIRDFQRFSIGLSFLAVYFVFDVLEKKKYFLKMLFLAGIILLFTAIVEFNLHLNFINLLFGNVNNCIYNAHIKKIISDKCNKGNVLVLFDNQRLFFPENCITPDVYAKKFIVDMINSIDLRNAKNIKYIYMDFKLFDLYNNQYKLLSENDYKKLFDLINNGNIIYKDSTNLIIECS